MYIKTKENIVKELQELTPKEINEAIRFNEIKRRQKNEQIISKRMLILDAESEMDALQVKISVLKDEIEEENRKQKIIDQLLTMLDKSKKALKFEETWNQLENEQITE